LVALEYAAGMAELPKRDFEPYIAAESELQLPARDTRNIEKAAEKEADDAARGRSIRQHADQQISSE